ncbi:MAG: hypothetical protein ABI333_09595 [bacterium]
MTTRRDFLTIAAAAAAELGLHGCCPTCPTGPGVRAAEMQDFCKRMGPKDPLWGGDLRMQFRTLECLVSALRAVPQYGKVLAPDVKKRFKELNKELGTYSLSRTIAESWRLFYELTSRMHDYRNAQSRKSKVPVYAYNGHQHAARMWLDEAARKKLGPLVHFDTHDDMRGLNKPAKILEAVKRVQAGGKQRVKGLDEIIEHVHDHATPVSGGVLGHDFGDVVWCFPYWAYASEFGRRPCFYADVPHNKSSYGSFRLLHDKAEDQGRLLPTYSTMPWLETSSVKGNKLRGMTHRRSFRMTLIKTYPSGGLFQENERWQALLKAVPRGPFVLDVDADYFMSIDSNSGFHRNPDTKQSGSRKRQLAVDEYERRLKKARGLLDRRLRSFKTLITKLRDNGRTPSIVTIADSTYMPFASTMAGKGYWEYMPYEFAGYVHWKLRALLQDVYDRRGIDAGV